MAIKLQSAKRQDGPNYENFNILDAEGNWTGVNISFNADREFSDENIEVMTNLLEEQLGVTVTQDKPSATKAVFKPKSKK